MRLHLAGAWLGARFAGLALIVAIFLAPPAAAQSQTPAIPDALKQAGLAALPEFLNAATNNITLRFPAALGGGTLTFGGTIDA